MKRNEENAMKKLWYGVPAALAGFCLWQFQELCRFGATEYVITHEKIKTPRTAVVIADLHGFRYGKGNRRLIAAVQSAKPDMILIPGDMIVGKQYTTYRTAEVLMRRLRGIAPVYYSYGNHESRSRQRNSRSYDSFMEYEKRLREDGITLLNNESVSVGEDICLTGLELPLNCYQKGVVTPYPHAFVSRHVPKADRERYQILLAHNPAYAKEYVRWGANLSLCGHFHGGLIRIPGVGSLISPQFQWRPDYDAGEFAFGKDRAIVSRGMGTHTFHIRIFNRAELVVVRLRPVAMRASTHAL